MYSHNVYVSAGTQVNVSPQNDKNDDNDIHDKKDANKNSTEKLLEKLSKQALKGKNTLEDVKKAFFLMEHNDTDTDKSSDSVMSDDTKSAIKMLQDMGYVKDGKKWLTKKGFDAISRMILRDIMKNIKFPNAGNHPTNLRGSGEITMDNTRKYEFGDDPKNLSAHETLLNAILNNKTNAFPLDIATSDMTVYETYSDARTSVVYCIDLSSTMKTKMKDGTSRMESAKKALWGLYGANTRYFSADSVHVVGFASMAARINPYDIPYLKAFDADEFLHYTNYQAALQMSRKILRNDMSENKKIVLITDGQPSACYAENDYQRDMILSEKPYSNFYSPESDILDDIYSQKSMKLDVSAERQVYLCYRYKKVDSRIHAQTIREAKKCTKDGIDIDTVVITDEPELVEYGIQFAKETRGNMFHASDGDMAAVLVRDYMGRSGVKVRHGL